MAESESMKIPRKYYQNLPGKLGQQKIISWNLTKFQHIQLIQTIFISIFSIRCLIVLKFCEVSRNSSSNRDAENFSFLSWKTKKFYS